MPYRSCNRPPRNADLAHSTIPIPSLAGGGAERTVLKIAGGLARREHRVDLVLFVPLVAYPKEVPGAARLIVLCGRAQWVRREKANMPPGTVWRTERAPHAQLARLAAGLVRDFPAGASIPLRRAALGRALRLVRCVERERPDNLFANFAPAEYPAFFARRLAVPGDFPPIVPSMWWRSPAALRRTSRRRLACPCLAKKVRNSKMPTGSTITHKILARFGTIFLR